MTELPAVDDRAELHRALGEPTRLRIVDELLLTDRSPKQLAELTGVPANLLSFHLDVLEEVGLIERVTSQGDARRRYLRLRPDRLSRLTDPRPLLAHVHHVVFVCTANSARSQLAAHLWQARTGRPASSAGTEPAEQVHPAAIEIARQHGLDLTGAVPRRYEDLEVEPDLVVSVCDRAHESAPSLGVLQLHWSVPDPVDGARDGFAHAFELLSERIERLACAVPAA